MRRGGLMSGRLEAVLDRSWEIQPVTWRQLTWWDPFPCGEMLLTQMSREDPFPFPSPALSMLTNPPTPHRQRRMAPTHLSFRSSSPSPIPLRQPRHQQASSSSPLAWPLPPSPDSYGSVFLPNSPDPSTPPVNNSPASSFPFSSSYPARSMAMSESMLRRATTLLPTPPDSEERQRKPGAGQRSHSYKVFNFPMPPPPPQMSPGLLPLPPPLMNRPPPLFR
eukprot:TRINITY_DN20156_c0_g1_i1.p1 TRINITY_DN20156_c0_g1~~TRINITY_DN20156_c0_g1_i1.p1  ORF type:complete len:221 (+),score=37.93 TRINITY_DN20156_c0_g1_i1:69-731(+)